MLVGNLTAGIAGHDVYWTERDGLPLVPSEGACWPRIDVSAPIG